MEHGTKKSGLVLTLTILVIVLFVICIKLWVDRSNALRIADEYKTAFESAQEAKMTAEQYQTSYNQLVSNMLQDAVLAEIIGNLTVKVWNNAIWQKRDADTDKFTMVNDQFVADFNDALTNLASDESFSSDISILSENQQQTKALMKEMLDPPEGYENAFKALEGMYNAYINLTNIVLSGNGSLESYSNEFSEADKELSEQYQAADLYVK
jgi:hypothetical protein